MNDDGQRPPLTRQDHGRLVAGVARGVADHLRVSVTLVRLVFVLFASTGLGLAAYLALWLLVDRSDPTTASRRPHGRWAWATAMLDELRSRPGDEPHRVRRIVGYLLVGVLARGALSAFGLDPGGSSDLPVTVACVGAVLIWWRAPDSQREVWARGARRYRVRIGRAAPGAAVGGGILLVLIGVAAFVAAHRGSSEPHRVALAIGATFVGLLLVFGPWLLGLIRDLSAERAARVRAQERAEVAAHLHDSVLQTLALIQSRASDAEAVRRLARRQERALRSWLYQPAATDGTSFAEAIRAAAAEVDDEHGVRIDVVVVGDVALKPPLQATVAAAREAMVNAARSSGASEVQVFAEVAGDTVEIFVRDRGRGFDLATVPEDRRGIRDSIIGRMSRHGGSSTVRSGPGGTEVHLRMGAGR